MQTISRLVNWPVDDVKALNPVYKSTYIPLTKPSQCISGPLEKIGLLVSLEDSLYVLEKKLYSTQVPQAKPIIMEPTITDTIEVVDSLGVDQTPNLESYIYHKVKTGETMGTIATKYGITVEQIMEWNALRTTNIYVGQRLKLKNGAGGVSQTPPVSPTPAPAKKYYSVRSGDTFSKIAQRHGLTQTQLSRLNPGVNINRLTVGQRIRVK
jgi:membrane-bound lytic murein transglycosylase D